MAKFSLRYHDSAMDVTIPDAALVGSITPKPPLNLKLESQMEVITGALENPIGTGTLFSHTVGRIKAAVVVSDITRLAPTRRMLPPILEELKKGGIKEGNITVIIGSGNHRQVTEEEKKQIVGPEIYERYKCVDSQEGRYIRLGITSRGTPVEVSEYAAEADLKIFTGNIELHRLAGFSGGVKACIGISGKAAIEHNHKLSRLGPFPLGELENNPVRNDLEEYAGILGVDFLLNVVTDETGNVEAAFAGDPIRAHSHGVGYAKVKFFRPFARRAGIVIVSAGGSPKDTSLYQALKAIQNGMEALAEGGILIAVASCHEGFGDSKFKEWIFQSSDFHDILRRSKKEFVLGGHKSLALAGVLQKGEVYLVSAMEEQDVRKAGFHHFQSLQIAVDTALTRINRPEVLVMPYGGVTVPYLVSKYQLVRS